MATYGSGQMLGSGINPESFKQDYSGFTRAAEIQAQGLSNLGGSIAGAIKDYGEAKQERKKLDAGIKATVTGIESAIKMGDSLGIDVKSSLTPYLDKINDPNVTPTEAAAYAQEASSAINNILNFGMKANQLGIEEDQNIRAARIKQAELEAAANKLGPLEKIAVAGGEQDMVRNPRTGVYERIKVAPLSSESKLVDLVKGFEGFNPNAYSDYKQTSIGYGTKGKEGEVINEEQATERLKSELSESAKRIERASILKGVSLNENQLNSLASFDYNTGKGIDLIERFSNKPNELAAKMQEYTKAGGKTLPGLVERRQIEAALFMTPPQPPVGFTPSKNEKTETIMTQEQVDQLVNKGAKVDAIPMTDGRFVVSSATISGKTTKESESLLEEKIRVNKEAADYYKKGDRASALYALRGLSAQDPVFGSMTDASLDAYFKQVSLPEVGPPAPTKNDNQVPNSQNPTQPKKPLSEIIK